MSNEAAGVDHWIANLKPEHRVIAEKVDALLQANVPNCIRLTKWHKPSQPLGIPFYGIEGKSWIVALWSFKNSFGIGFFSGTLLSPEPKVDKMAGPWNKHPTMKARRYDVSSIEDLDEKQLLEWIIQVIQLPGWGSTTT